MAAAAAIVCCCGSVDVVDGHEMTHGVKVVPGGWVVFHHVSPVVLNCGWPISQPVPLLYNINYRVQALFYNKLVKTLNREQAGNKQTG